MLQFIIQKTEKYIMWCLLFKFYINSIRCFFIIKYVVKDKQLCFEIVLKVMF
jgi:hypothetical protein